MPPTLSLPYEGSRALFKFGQRWVTSNLKTEIRRARRTRPFRDYCREKYGWDDDDYNLISWKSVGRVRRSLDRVGFRQTSKIMHGWLATGHMHGHATKVTQCPGCSCTDETIGHMLRCPNRLMDKKRQEILHSLRKKGLRSRVPKRVIEVFCRLLEHYLTECKGDPLRGIYYRPTRQAAHQQMAIGLEYMPWGFVHGHQSDGV